MEGNGSRPAPRSPARGKEVEVEAHPSAVPLPSSRAESTGKSCLPTALALFTVSEMVVAQNIGARLDAELVERLDRLATLLSARAAGTPVKRSDAVRLAVTRGLDVLERELGVEECVFRTCSAAPVVARVGPPRYARMREDSKRIGEAA